jgi:alpha-mannosidase II
MRAIPKCSNRCSRATSGSVAISASARASAGRSIRLATRPPWPTLLQRVGFDAIVINRVHYAVKKMLAENQALEFYWEQRWQPSDAPRRRATTSSSRRRFTRLSQVLTHMFPFYSYDVPHTCGPEPAICCEFDFARGSCPWPGHYPTPITAANIAAQAEKLLDQYRKKSHLYRSWRRADSGRRRLSLRFARRVRRNMFNNYQQLFDYINSHADQYHAHVRFANLSSYFDSVHSRLRVRSALPVVRGDFFTYADRDQDYWSGYFTSRPFYKRLGRRAQATVRAAELLHSLTHVLLPGAGAEPPSLRGSLLDARRTMGIFQHHDAVTGTAKTHVNDDYGRMLHRARHAMRAAMRDSITR